MKTRSLVEIYNFEVKDTSSLFPWASQDYAIEQCIRKGIHEGGCSGDVRVMTNEPV